VYIFISITALRPDIASFCFGRNSLTSSTFIRRIYLKILSLVFHYSAWCLHFTHTPTHAHTPLAIVIYTRKEKCNKFVDQLAFVISYCSRYKIHSYNIKTVFVVNVDIFVCIMLRDFALCTKMIWIKVTFFEDTSPDQIEKSYSFHLNCSSSGRSLL
jgi:hypothetical protein